MRTRGGKYGPRCFQWVIALFMGGAALVLLLAAAASAQSLAAPSVTPTTATTQDVFTPTTPSTAPGPSAQTGAGAVVPPAAGFTPLNPGWKTDQMVVQVWPEYDEKAVLVFMNFSLPADVQLPATFKFAVPKGAAIAGIGEIDPNGSFTFNYADSYPPVQAGADWDIATIQVQKYRELQIDYYYDPGLPAGAGGRSFPVLLQLPLDAAALNLHVQQPARATDFKVQPDLQGSGEAGDGFTYSTATFSEVNAGSTLGYVISYSKPDGDPSAKPSESAPAKLSTNSVLLAAILVVVVCIGGLVIYRLYRKAGKSTQARGQGHPRTRPEPAAAAKDKRPSAKPRNTDTNQGEKVNRYCFACGEELAKKARFCPNCGESQDD